MTVYNKELSNTKVYEFIDGVNCGFRELGYDYRVAFVPAKYDTPNKVCLTFGNCGASRDELHDICFNVARGVTNRIGGSVSDHEAWCDWSSDEVSNRDRAVMVMMELVRS